MRGNNTPSSFKHKIHFRGKALISKPTGRNHKATERKKAESTPISKEILSRKQKLIKFSSFAFLSIGCAAAIMYALVMFYVSYIKKSEIFLFGGVGVFCALPIVFFVSYDLYCIIYKNKWHIDVIDYTSIIICSFVLVFGVIAIIIEYF